MAVQVIEPDYRPRRNRVGLKHQLKRVGLYLGYQHSQFAKKRTSGLGDRSGLACG